MYLKISKKTSRNDELMTDDKKKRSSEEDKNTIKKNYEKTSENNERLNRLRPSIGRRNINQEYPLPSIENIDRIIEEKEPKYMNMDAYEKLLETSIQNCDEKYNKRQPSNSPNSVRSLCDEKAKETNYCTSDKDENTKDVYDYESVMSKSDMKDTENEHTNEKKRKYECCNLEDEN